MARIVSLGSALQDIYLIDHDDFVSSKEGDVEKLGQIVVGSKVDIDKISFEVGIQYMYFFNSKQEIRIVIYILS